MGRTRILIVEDDPIILDLITTRLDIAGYDTYFARDGFGLLRKMRQEGLNVPTMVLTARNQPDDVQQAITLGARDFLAKPFKDEQLLQRVGRLLRRAPVRPPKASLPMESPPAVRPPIDDGPQPFLL